MQCERERAVAMGAIIIIILFLFPILITLIISSCLLLPKWLSPSKVSGEHLSPPSPPSIPILNHLHLLKPPRHLSMLRLSRLYGPVVSLRLGSRPALLISSPSAVEECLSKNDVAFANHPNIIAGQHVGYNNSSMFFAPYGPHWRNLRRIAASELLSARCLSSFASVRREEVMRMAKRMLSGVDGDGRGAVEFRVTLFEMTYNAVSKVVGGRRYYGEEGEAVSLKEARWFRSIVGEGLPLVMAFNPGDFFPVLAGLDVRGLKKRLDQLRHKLEAFVSTLVEENRRRRSGCLSANGGRERGGGEEGSRRNTLTDVLLSLQDADPQYYTQDIIKGLVLTILTGGSDSTVDTLESAMLLLLTHPSVLHKARAELDAHVGDGRVLDESDLPKLPYLHCIIQEVLRLCPPRQSMPPRESSSDCTVLGYHVPAGTMLFINIWSIHRDPQLWDEPDRFKPERFAGENQRWKEKFHYFPFGSGRRSCPGEGLAMRLLGLTLGVLIQCFEWEPATEEEVDLSAVLGLTEPKQGEKTFVAGYRRRDAMAAAINDGTWI